MSEVLLTSAWLQRLAGYHRLVVGFSGGLDSTVLLHCLSRQSNIAGQLLAVHINHGLNPKATQWQRHCQALCAQWGITFVSEQVDFDRNKNREAGARTARYQAFSNHLQTGAALLLAHHQDDQAETLLLNLFRGTGISGLSAMQPDSLFHDYPLLRPFLHISRSQLEAYAQLHALNWVEDDSNLDEHYARNYLRQTAIPSLAQRWPGLVGNLTRTASHCQQAELNLADLARIDGQKAIFNHELDWSLIQDLPPHRLANIMHYWLQLNRVRMPSTLTFQRLCSEMFTARVDSQPAIAWDGWIMRRYQTRLYLLPHKMPELPEVQVWHDFPQPIYWGGKQLIVHGQVREEKLKVEIRRRQGGEQLVCHGQHQSVKNLLQEKQIPPWDRAGLPLIYVNGQLAVIPGVAKADSLGWDIVIGIQKA